MGAPNLAIQLSVVALREWVPMFPMDPLGMPETCNNCRSQSAPSPAPNGVLVQPLLEGYGSIGIDSPLGLPHLIQASCHALNQSCPVTSYLKNGSWKIRTAKRATLSRSGYLSAMTTFSKCSTMATLRGSFCRVRLFFRYACGLPVHLGGLQEDCISALA